MRNGRFEFLGSESNFDFVFFLECFIIIFILAFGFEKKEFFKFYFSFLENNYYLIILYFNYLEYFTLDYFTKKISFQINPDNKNFTSK